MCRDRLGVTEGELLIAIELADAANDMGEAISVGVDRIADRSRQHPRTVKRCLSKFRSAGWLEIVGEGGMRGGRGHATLYRINATWLRGDVLTGFPDYVPQHDPRLIAEHAAALKGDKLPPIEQIDGGQTTQNKGDSAPPLETERVTNSNERVTKRPLKGDTAVSPDPSTHIPSDAHAREQRPSGSRAHAKDEPLQRPAYDVASRRAHWYSIAVSQMVADAWLLELVPRGVQLEQFPQRIRDDVVPRLRDAVGWALGQEQDARLAYRDIVDGVQRDASRAIREIPRATSDEVSAMAA